MKACSTGLRELDTNRVCFCFQKLGFPGSEPSLVAVKPHPFGWGGRGSQRQCLDATEQWLGLLLSSVPESCSLLL